MEGTDKTGTRKNRDLVCIMWGLPGGKEEKERMIQAFKIQETRADVAAPIYALLCVAAL